MLAATDVSAAGPSAGKGAGGAISAAIGAAGRGPDERRAKGVATLLTTV